MTRGTRNRDWQLAARIEVTEQNVRHGMSGLLSKIPALENRGYIPAEMVDREWSSVEQKNNHGLAGRKHRLHQLFLASDQIQTRAVAHMFEIPRFARRLFVAANGEHDDIRFLRDLHRFSNLLAIFLRITRNNFINIPRSANGDLAAFAVKNLHLFADLGFDTVEHGHVVLRNAAVT